MALLIAVRCLLAALYLFPIAALADRPYTRLTGDRPMTNGNEPAHPSATQVEWDDPQYGRTKGFRPGLTKREHFAALAMQAMGDQMRLDRNYQREEGDRPQQDALAIGRAAVRYADGLLAALNETTP